MKKLGILFYCAILFTIVSCNTTSNELDNECNIVENSYSENEYMENIHLLLADFEYDVTESLAEAQNLADFDKILKEKQEAKIISEELKSGMSDDLTSEKDSLMRLTVDNFKSSIYYGYDDFHVEGSKEEFLNYLQFQKENFVNEVESMDFLDSQKDKDILIALMYFEIGLFEINLEHLEEFIALDNVLGSSVVLKSVSDLTWWQYTKRFAECYLLSYGTAASFAVMLLLPPAQFFGTLGALGFSWFAWDCWVNLYNDMHS